MARIARSRSGRPTEVNLPNPFYEDTDELPPRDEDSASAADLPDWVFAEDSQRQRERIYALRTALFLLADPCRDMVTGASIPRHLSPLVATANVRTARAICAHLGLDFTEVSMSRTRLPAVEAISYTQLSALYDRASYHRRRTREDGGEEGVTETVRRSREEPSWSDPGDLSGLARKRPKGKPVVSEPEAPKTRRLRIRRPDNE